MKLDQAKSIFIVGIKGVAMANLAVIFKKMGKKVTGSETDESQITDELLIKHHIHFSIGFDPTVLPKDIDLLIYSAAHGGTTNPQVIEAKKRNISVVNQAEVLGDLIKKYKISIAVCGCHGKTTTSALLSYMLLQLHSKVTYLIGAPSFTDCDGGGYQGDEVFAFEADEYGINPPYDTTPKLNYFDPTDIICTNIDYDHPDIYPSIEAVIHTFYQFFKRKKLILCHDDRNTASLFGKLEKNNYVTYGFESGSDYQITHFSSDHTGIHFEIIKSGLKIGFFSVGLFGEKNALNVTAVIIMLLQMGYNVRDIQNKLSNFKGIKRRFELLYTDNNTFLFDDYAHHPEEIKATISAARVRFPGKKILIIFHPHTYSRTQSLLQDFAQSLSLADKSFILPIFSSAREKKEEFNVSSFDIANKGTKGRIEAFEENNKILHALSQNIKKGEVIFTMGAGDVYKLKDDIIHIIKSKIQMSNSKPNTPS